VFKAFRVFKALLVLQEQLELRGQQEVQEVQARLVLGFPLVGLQVRLLLKTQQQITTPLGGLLAAAAPLPLD
jgi:hypothetical protein